MNGLSIVAKPSIPPIKPLIMMKKLTLTLLWCMCALFLQAQDLDPLPNHDFEDWFIDSTGKEVPAGLPWVYFDEGWETRVEKSSDAYSGGFALRVNSYDTNAMRIYGDIYAGECCEFGTPFGTYPYEGNPAFFGFYYKYLAEGPDSAIISLQFRDTILGTITSNNLVYLPPVGAYTKVYLPLSHANNASTVMFLRFTSTLSGDVSLNLGRSALYVDSIFFTNDTTGPSHIAELAPQVPFHIFPHPVQNQLWIQGTFSGEVHIYDMLGKHCVTQAATQHEPLDVAALLPGLYIIRLQDKQGDHYLRMVKE